MKLNSLLPGLLCVTLLGLSAGCGSRTSIDTNPLETAFASAPPEVKGPVDQAVTALKNGDLQTGANSLLAAVQAGHRDFTEPQKDAMYNMIEQIQKMMAENTKVYSSEVQQTFREMDAIMQGQPLLTVPRTNPPEPNP
jgi:hypothetical protein